MPGRDEISSTEKLLDLIRNKSDEDFEFIVDSPSGPSPRGLGSFFKRLFPFGRTLTLGVDIGYSDLKLAKMGQSSDRRPELVDYLTVPFDSGISRDSPTFPHFLHSALTGFCGSPRRMNIWSIISGAKVDIRYLRIPKLSKKEIPNAVYWSFKKESPFEENDFIIDFEILGDVVEEGLEKIGVLAYIAPQEEIGDLKAIFAKADLPLTIIACIPFAFAGSSSKVEFQSYTKAYDKDFEDVRRRVPNLGRLEQTISIRPQYDLDAIIAELAQPPSNGPSS